MSIEQEKKLHILFTLGSLLRTARIHDDKNMQAIECADNFINAVSAGCEGDDLTLLMDSGRFFVGDEKILYDNESAVTIQTMLDYFAKRQLAGFTFSSEISDVSYSDIFAFAKIVNDAGGMEDSAVWLAEKIHDKYFMWVELFEPVSDADSLETGRETTEDAPEGRTRGEHARKLYSYGLANLKEVARKLGAGRKTGINKSVRLVQNMVNLLNDDEPVMLGLSTLRIYDDYTYAHSVNVALLALCIGKRIGLSRSALEKLGLCGLFHDLGKVDISLDILQKPGKLTDHEFRLMRAHSLHSVRQIAKLRAPRSRKAPLILAPFEHHMKFDHSGYPKAANWRISLFGSIITIADVFDAITSPRVYRKSAPSPDRALGYMVKKAGKDFDPILLKVFVEMLGIYPPGTLVELDSEEIGIVIDTPQENNAAGLPRVRLLLPDGSDGYIKGAIVSLAERSSGTGAYLREINNTVHPADYNIQPVQYFF